MVRGVRLGAEVGWRAGRGIQVVGRRTIPARTTRGVRGPGEALGSRGDSRPRGVGGEGRGVALALSLCGLSSYFTFYFTSMGLQKSYDRKSHRLRTILPAFV